MSNRADLERSRRRSWAARGGRHDRFVRALQLGLPALVGALGAIMLLAPFGHKGEISFLVAKDSIDVAGQRMRVSGAQYRGNDAQGRPFVLSAVSALQRSAADPIVRMEGLSAQILLADGPARLTASSAGYDPTRDTVMVDGALDLTAADGYRLQSRGVLVDLKARTVTTNQPVSGATNIGSFSAGGMSADLNARILRLSGRAHMRINQGI